MGFNKILQVGKLTGGALALEEDPAAVKPVIIGGNTRSELDTPGTGLYGATRMAHYDRHGRALVTRVDLAAQLHGQAAGSGGALDGVLLTGAAGKRMVVTELTLDLHVAGAGVLVEVFFATGATGAPGGSNRVFSGIVSGFRHLTWGDGKVSPADNQNLRVYSAATDAYIIATGHLCKFV